MAEAKSKISGICGHGLLGQTLLKQHVLFLAFFHLGFIRKWKGRLS
jgi:hypothetical protein